MAGVILAWPSLAHSARYSGLDLSAGSTKNAVVPVLDVGKTVAEQPQQVIVRGKNCAVQAELATAFALPMAAICPLAFNSFSSSESCIVFSADSSWPVSSWLIASIVLSSLPSATARAISTARPSGLTIDRIVRMHTTVPISRHASANTTAISMPACASRTATRRPYPRGPPRSR